MKPIILTTREIRGLLDGTIDTIRREIKPQPKLFYGGVAKIIYGRHPFGSDQISEAVGYEVGSGIKAGAMAWLFEDWCGNVVGVADENWLKPPFQPGDVLYAKETWAKYNCASFDSVDIDCHKCLHSDKKPDYDEGGIMGEGCYLYKASCKEAHEWKPSIFMPREAARLFLSVEDARAERVQEITPRGAWDEGCRIGRSFPWEDHIPDLQNMCRDIVYKSLWDDLHAKRGIGWDANPWTWVFKVKTISADEARERENQHG